MSCRTKRCSTITIIILRRKKIAKKKKFPREFKESVLRRLEEPTNESIASICEELGISRSTVYKWINEKGDFC